MEIYYEYEDNPRDTALKKIYLSLVYIFLYLPIAVVICFSFNATHHSLLWQHFTLKWYSVLYHDADLIYVTLHSLTIGFIAATVATGLGTLASICLFRYRFRGKTSLSALLFALIIIPDIVMAISFLLLYRTLHISLGFWTLLLAHITFCTPFVFITTKSRLDHLDQNMIEAARDLGAKEHTILFKIFIPLLWPALIAGWLLSFTLSLDDVIISFFTTGPDFTTLPLKIYSMVRLGVSPEINALSTLLLTLTFMIVITSQLILRKK